MSKVLTASLRVLVALRDRQEYPIFSRPYNEADCHLCLAVQDLNALLKRMGRIKEPLHIAAAIRYAEAVARPRICN